MSKPANKKFQQEYVQGLIDEKQKRMKESYVKARSYLESIGFYEKTQDEKIDYLLEKDGLLLIEGLSSDKHSITTISELLGFTQGFFHNLMRDEEKIFDAVDRGRTRDIDEVEQALYKMAKGYYVTEKRNKYYYNDRNDTESKQTEDYERFIPSNFAAAQYILNNKRQQEYKDKQIEYEIAKNTIHVEVELIGDDELNLE